jgi:hypothetical protein
MRYVVGLLAAICCAALADGRFTPAEAKRVALVIGNAEYKIGPLRNPVNDAAAVAVALEKQLRFDKVILKRNLGFSAFRAALIEMARESADADLGLVYFAGHGTEVGGRNFLIPVDATLATGSALDVEAIPLDTVLGQLGKVRKLKLVILDACRNNPFPLAGGKRSVSRGLARIEPEDNTLVAYAARDGTTADDGVGRRHSPFTESLLKHIATPGLEVQLLFRRIRDDVIKATRHAGQPQQPHVYASLGAQELYLQMPRTFDGGWLATMVCATAPDGAQGFTREFVVGVTEGVLHGQIGAKGMPDWFTLDGKIDPGGSAILTATGLTGDSKFSMGRARPGTPYSYIVTARFEGARGTARRADRDCSIAFVKR